jgi:hypothetical protein
MKNKPDPALLQTSYLSSEIKKDTKISWDYPFKEDTLYSVDGLHPWSDSRYKIFMLRAHLSIQLEHCWSGLSQL